MGLLLILYGAYILMTKESGRPTGKWALVFGPIHDSFGNFGIAMAWMVTGVALALLGLLYKGDEK